MNFGGCFGIEEEFWAGIARINASMIVVVCVAWIADELFANERGACCIVTNADVYLPVEDHEVVGCCCCAFCSCRTIVSHTEVNCCKDKSTCVKRGSTFWLWNAASCAACCWNSWKREPDVWNSAVAFFWNSTSCWTACKTDARSVTLPETSDNFAFSLFKIGIHSVNAVVIGVIAWETHSDVFLKLQQYLSYFCPLC